MITQCRSIIVDHRHSKFILIQFEWPELLLLQFQFLSSSSHFSATTELKHFFYYYFASTFPLISGVCFAWVKTDARQIEEENSNVSTAFHSLVLPITTRQMLELATGLKWSLHIKNKSHKMECRHSRLLSPSDNNHYFRSYSLLFPCVFSGYCNG